tara:strand:+ start:1020 stop:1214 length:195 start_codon:yes stop_codon:yes gene_type:complete
MKVWRRKVNKEIEKKLDKLIHKVEKLQLTIEELDAKLNKHIGFIDDTYEGLKNPINAARKFFGR